MQIAGPPLPSPPGWQEALAFGLVAQVGSGQQEGVQEEVVVEGGEALSRQLRAHTPFVVVLGRWSRRQRPLTPQSPWAHALPPTVSQ
jgi:hypothetical protein